MKYYLYYPNSHHHLSKKATKWLMNLSQPWPPIYLALEYNIPNKWALPEQYKAAPAMLNGKRVQQRRPSDGPAIEPASGDFQNRIFIV